MTDHSFVRKHAKMRLGTRTLKVCLLGVVATVLSLFGASTAFAAVNPNPIDWTIYKTYLGKDGDDIPLRQGQHDAGPIDGFGMRHIEDGHGPQDWDGLSSTMIQMALDGGCNHQDATTVRCEASGTYNSILIYSTRVDPASGDGRPVGVITNYYWCNC